MRQRWHCWLLQLLPGIIPHSTVIQYNISVIQYNIIQHNVSVIQYSTVVIPHNVFLHNISVIQYNTVTQCASHLCHEIYWDDLHVVHPRFEEWY